MRMFSAPHIPPPHDALETGGPLAASFCTVSAPSDNLPALAAVNLCRDLPLPTAADLFFADMAMHEEVELVREHGITVSLWETLPRIQVKDDAPQGFKAFSLVCALVLFALLAVSVIHVQEHRLVLLFGGAR